MVQLPYSANIKTNVGKEFLNLVDKCFPKSNPLHKVFNRQTLKISYKCMPNMAAEISKHNNKVLKEGGTPPPPPPANVILAPSRGGVRKLGWLIRP